MSINVYLVFVHDDYYSLGGMSDSLGSYINLDEAIQCAKKHIHRDNCYVYDCIHGLNAWDKDEVS